MYLILLTNRYTCYFNICNDNQVEYLQYQYIYNTFISTQLDLIKLKKIFAMAMLALLLFNIGGYMLLFQYFIYRSDNSITERINHNHYRSKDLVEVKIPVHLNIQDWDDYALISGQVQFKDNCYNYAELRMTRDTMYLLCIPNHDKTRLVNANIIYAKQISDIPSGKKSHVPLIKKSISESESNYPIIRYQALIIAQEIKAGHGYAFSDIIKASIDVPGQPPEVQSILS
jgi:hypothetical protein